MRPYSFMRQPMLKLQLISTFISGWAASATRVKHRTTVIALITFSISSIAQPPDADHQAPLAADFLEFLADFSDDQGEMIEPELL